MINSRSDQILATSDLEVCLQESRATFIFSG